MNQPIPKYTCAEMVLEVLNRCPKRNYIFMMKSSGTGNLVPIIVDFKNTLYGICSIQVFMQLKETGKLKAMNVAVPVGSVHYHYYLDIQDRGDTPKIGELATAGSPCPNTNNSQLK